MLAKGKTCVDQTSLQPAFSQHKAQHKRATNETLYTWFTPNPEVTSTKIITSYYSCKELYYILQLHFFQSSFSESISQISTKEKLEL